jgi:hypothetical protein
MSLTSCRECGTAVPANSHACPKCGASMAPVSYAAYRPAPRPPAEPERPWWRTVRGWGGAAGWAVIVGALVLLAVSFVRGSAEAGRRATEEAEMKREQEHLRLVNAWVQDTSVNAPPPDSAGRPAPTSDRAKRMWVISRMLVERSLWEREIMKRHGVGGRGTPAAWDTPRYQASARDYPEVGTYLEGRVAAFAEMEKDSAAWMEERVAALARESGMPASEIREILPRGLSGVTPEERREADVMLEVHRHYLRIDPWVRYAGGERLLYERPDETRVTDALVEKLHAAYAATNQARDRLTRERVALSHAIE